MSNVSEVKLLSFSTTTATVIVWYSNLLRPKLVQIINVLIFDFIGSHFIHFNYLLVLF